MVQDQKQEIQSGKKHQKNDDTHSILEQLKTTELEKQLFFQKEQFQNMSL